MPQVVQAICPACKNTLRIPADWLSQPMKCKFCQGIFLSKPKSAHAAPLVAASSHTSLTAPSGSHFQFDSPSTGPALVPAVGRPKSGWGKGLVLAACLLVIGGLVAVFAGPHLAALFNSKDPDSRVAVGPEKEKESENPTKVNGAKKGELETPKKEPKNEEPKKVDPPKIVDPPKKKETAPVGKKETTTPKGVAGQFPRRALLINVSNYLLFNPLHYGSARSGKYPGSSSAVLADQFNRPPFNIPASQITELSDGAKDPFPTSKQVIETTVADFLESSRDQDRLVLLFSGHALEHEKEAYLVPVEGNRDDPKTLVPLAWVYSKLANCRARQKLLILDVFRFPPARGEELPGTGEMTEDFDAQLLAPPPGVQVWSSCIKGQQSVEGEQGSLFLQALCNTLQERLPGIAEPTDVLPVEQLVPKVNQRLAELLGRKKVEQMSRLSGKEADGGAAYDGTLPLAPKLVLRPPMADGQKAAGLAVVKNVLDEINRLPTVRETQQQLQIASLPYFSAKALDEYKPDYKTLVELEAMGKDAEKFPIRAAVFKIVEALRESKKITMLETLGGAAGTQISQQVKNGFLKEQQAPGLMIFHLETLKTEIDQLAEKRDMETSKRWLANFDYAYARLLSRIVYIYEYNNILAQVRGDSLPELEPIHSGWRVGSQKKVQINEPKVKDMIKTIGRTWKRIAEENQGTPWAILAQRENLTALGLVWRPKQD
ncbi:MAG: caspase family protein [Gemmataceae bacterium]|nr:caspase family protein [Gemmataceae bacterium]